MVHKVASGFHYTAHQQKLVQGLMPSKGSQ